MRKEGSTTALRTKRLLLREFELADLPAYTALRSDPQFQKCYPSLEVTAPTSEELLQQFLRWSAETPRLRYQLAIQEAGAGLLGSVGVRIVAEGPRTASFGCEVKREHWGRGYAYEAARAVIGFAFSTLGVERILAETTAGNTAALGLARKLGMRPAAELEKLSARTSNSVMLALSSSEWTA